MRRSIGLTAYRTLTSRRPVSPYIAATERPVGELVWIHAAESGNNRTLNDLAHRLVAMNSGCYALLTAAQDTFGDRGVDEVIVETVPPEHPVATDAFVAHWRPDAVLWAWGGLRPNLIQSAAASGAYMMLVDAGQSGFEGRRDRWLPEVPRRLLDLFDVAMARSNEAKTRLIQLGRPKDRIELTVPLRPFGRVTSAADSDVIDVTEALGGRPVWLAANATGDEVETILAAHRQALKVAHRLLLILQTPDPIAARPFLDRASQAGLRAASWDDGDMPDDNTQVLISGTDSDLGLWLRISPVTCLGGTLEPGHDCLDPYSVAAHGSAIIYGPYVGQYTQAFTQLMNAGAARIVNDAATLGIAVTQMIAPDRAAIMAMAGWEVTTQGADSLDRIIQLVQSHLDAKSGWAG